MIVWVLLLTYNINDPRSLLSPVIQDVYATQELCEKWRQKVAPPQQEDCIEWHVVTWPPGPLRGGAQ